MMTYCLLYFIAVVILQTTVEAQSTSSPITTNWSNDTINRYPNPLNQPQDCNRLDKSYVCDPNKVLSEQAADNIDKQLSMLRNAEGGPCNSTSTSHSYTGIPIIVAVMENFQPSEGSTVKDLMKSYAEHIARWEFYDCDDAIVYVIGYKVTSGNKVYRYYASKSQNFLGTECESYIAKKSTSDFNDGDIVEGITIDTSIYSKILAGEECKDNEVMFIAIIIIVIIVAVIVAIIIAIVFIKKRQRQKAISQGMDRDVAKPLKRQNENA